MERICDQATSSHMSIKAYILKYIILKKRESKCLYVAILQLELQITVDIKMSGYSGRGSNSVIFIFASLLNGYQLLKEQILSVKSILHFGFIIQGSRIHLKKGICKAPDKRGY